MLRGSEEKRFLRLKSLPLKSGAPSLKMVPKTPQFLMDQLFKRVYDADRSLLPGRSVEQS